MKAQCATSSLLLPPAGGSLAARGAAAHEGEIMWTQIIKTHLKSGKDAELMVLMDQLQAIEQPGSGLVRSTAMRDQKDPSTVYMIVTFESEEKARAREQDERRQAGLQSVRETMAQIFDETPEFIDLDVVAEHSGI